MITIKDLKNVIKDLPDDMPVYIEPLGLHEEYKQIYEVKLASKSAINHAYLGLIPGKEFDW